MRTVIGSLMRSALETLGGLWALLMLAFKTRFRLRGPYWRWRHETAFGSDPGRMPRRAQRIRAMLEYGKWVWRMRRYR
jgi:hypothetical protein